MPNNAPVAELDSGFSSEGAIAIPWAEGQRELEAALMYWVSTVRPNGRPHVTPLFAVWLDGALYFASGPGEQKSKNLAHNPHCVVTTGCNVIKGLDVVLEGKAVRVRDAGMLQRVADAVAAKYADGAGLGDDWRFTVRDGAYCGPGGNEAYVYEIAPEKAFGFGKGEPFSQTRWRF